MSFDQDGEHPAAHEEPAAGHGDGQAAAVGHAASHGHGHGHAEDGEPLGPPDLAAWVYAVSGGLLGLVTALALFSAAHG